MMKLIAPDAHQFREIMPNPVSEHIYLVGSTINLAEMFDTAIFKHPVELTRDQAIDLGIIITFLESRYADYDKIDRVSPGKYEYFERLGDEGIDVATIWANHEYPEGRDLTFYQDVGKAVFNYNIISKDVLRFSYVTAITVGRVINVMRDIAENMGPFGIPDMLSVDEGTIAAMRLLTTNNIVYQPRAVSDVISNDGLKLLIGGLDLHNAADVIEALPLNRMRWGDYLLRAGVTLTAHESDMLASKVAHAWAENPRRGMRLERLDLKRLGISPEEEDELIRLANTAR